MIKPIKDTWIICMLGWFFAIGGGLLFWQQYTLFNHPWKSTKGFIDRFDQETTLNNKYYAGQIFYSFSIDGKKYIGSALDPSFGRAGFFCNMAEGSSIDVFYDESNPNYSYPIALPIPEARYVILGCVFFLGIFLLGLGFYRMKE